MSLDGYRESLYIGTVIPRDHDVYAPVEDKVYPGWDVGYALHGRDRLTRAERGTWGGSSIGSHKQDERWTLTQTGNWDLHRLDLNGDGDFTDTGELDDRGTFNVVR